MAEHCFLVTLRRGGSVTTVVDVPDTFEPKTSPVLVLAHGAGTDLRHAFLEDFATALSERGLCVVRFNFPYMEAARRRPPDPKKILIETYIEVVSASGSRTGSPPGPLFLGGKSMGCRVALEVCAAGRVRPSGLVYLGYPLHPPRKHDQLRVHAFKTVRRPMLFIQGTRDPYCDLDLLRQVRGEYRIPGSLHVIEGGDHSFGQPKSRAAHEQPEKDRAADVIVAFVKRVLRPSPDHS